MYLELNCKDYLKYNAKLMNFLQYSIYLLIQTYIDLNYSHYLLLMHHKFISNLTIIKIMIIKYFTSSEIIL